MEKERYIISDAAQIINVESHVLRYWEEELELKVPRNELGHRYYTKENIEQFQKIKELKEKGYQLKAIKMLMHGEAPLLVTEKEKPVTENVPEVLANLPQKSCSKEKIVSQLDPEEKMEQFQNMMTGIVKKAIEENNQALGVSVGEQVGEQVLKEMNYLMREQEDLAEEHYRKLDEAIRQHYKSKKIFRKSKEKSLQPKTT